MPLETTSKWHGYLVNSAIGLLMDDAQTFIDVIDKVRSYIHSPLGFVLIILFASDTI